MLRWSSESTSSTEITAGAGHFRAAARAASSAPSAAEAMSCPNGMTLTAVKQHGMQHCRLHVLLTAQIPAGATSSAALMNEKVFLKERRVDDVVQQYMTSFRMCAFRGVWGQPGLIQLLLLGTHPHKTVAAAAKATLLCIPASNVDHAQHRSDRTGAMLISVQFDMPVRPVL